MRHAPSPFARPASRPDPTLNIEYRFASGRVERLPELAVELVHLKPDVIVTPTTAASLAAKQATSTIPIVIAGVADAVGAGLVASIARPGGNVTGLTSISAELGGKRLELLKGVVPNASRVAVLHDPADRITDDRHRLLLRTRRHGLATRPSCTGSLWRMRSPATEASREREPAKVINLMDALRKSVESERGSGERRKPARTAKAHRAPKKAGRSSAGQKKAG